jgi:hypothetical protein
MFLIEANELAPFSVRGNPFFPPGNRRDVSAYLADLSRTPVSERVGLAV